MTLRHTCSGDGGGVGDLRYLLQSMAVENVSLLQILLQICYSSYYLFIY